MPQSEITDLAVGPAGLKLEGEDRTGTSEEATDGIPFGVMVCQGTADDGILLLNTSAAAMATKLKGILLFDHHFARNVELDANGDLAPQATGAILTEGTCLVLVEEAVAPGDPVRVRVVVEDDEVPGAFRTGPDDTSDCVNISKFAQWRSSADAGEYAELEINMTMSANATADS
jgi:hypothetical protein